MLKEKRVVEMLAIRFSVGEVIGAAFFLAFLHSPAHANCKNVEYAMDSLGKKHRVEYNCAVGGRSSDTAAIGLLGAGIGLLLQGLEDSPSPKNESNTAPRKPNAFDEISRERKATAERYQKLKKLERQASSDSSLDPWANVPSKKSKEEKKSDGRAPYADKNCVEIRRAGSGITWDSTRLTNKCAFPIQVLTCYYDKGEQSKCDNYKGGSWGTSNTIKAGSSTLGVSSSKRPDYGIRYFVCNMSGIKKSEKFCLLPKG
jgi:hypothetical protein